MNIEFEVQNCWRFTLFPRELFRSVIPAWILFWFWPQLAVYFISSSCGIPVRPKKTKLLGHLHSFTVIYYWNISNYFEVKTSMTRFWIQDQCDQTLVLILKYRENSNDCKWLRTAHYYFLSFVQLGFHSLPKWSRLPAVIKPKYPSPSQSSAIDFVSNLESRWV